MMKNCLLAGVVTAAIILSGCGNGSAPKVIPGAGGAHLYDLMEDDSTEMKKVDTTADASSR